MRIEIPELCVVALMGVSGAGKSTFAARHFQPTEVLSSDYFRGLMSNDENDNTVTAEAFETLYFVANKRLDRGLLTVIDATNVQREARAAVLELAKEQNVHAVAIVLDPPLRVCQTRHEQRTNRDFSPRVIARQYDQLRQSFKYLKKEGFRYVFHLRSEEEVENAEIIRTPLWNDKKHISGPFDIIGDIHGCYDELCTLLTDLGYEVDKENHQALPPQGRSAVFVGDLCDRGPKNTDVLRLVMNMVASEQAYCVAGNHEMKLLRKLQGRGAQMTHGFDVTVEQLSRESQEFNSQVETFVDGLISHYIFDQGKLVVAHAGLIEKYQGRTSGRVRAFCLYGDTTGERDDYGLPIRLPWANEYRGKALVVYGHTPTPEIEFINNTVCIDTGCVFGGKLTAYRYPEKEIVQVDALREYYAPVKPFLTQVEPTEELPAPAAAMEPWSVDEDGPVQFSASRYAPLPENPQSTVELLTIKDVLGAHHLSTRLRRTIKIQAENSAAALEVMSRYSADPRWLIYLPPTMSPCETSALPDYLEDPSSGFSHYRNRGVDKVVCEVKHMGSRAVVILCRDEKAAARRFKMDDGSIGIIYTRTGRKFFCDTDEKAMLTRLNTQLESTGFWEDFDTDWVCLDAELMPWSAKAQGLLKDQYAPVGRAGRGGLAASIEAVSAAAQVLHGSLSESAVDLSELLARLHKRADAVDRYVEAYRRYCWDVSSLDDYRLAPFHILATERVTYVHRNHVWHMENIARYITGTDPIFMATDYLVVNLHDDQGIAEATRWWQDITDAGKEGMVIKPFDFISQHGTELVQPAVKVRGREYLRIIYGPEYLIEPNLTALRERSLSRKRSLALNEFALGVESLERFIAGEPLHRIHECVFAILALESEPVDPRL